MNRLSICGLLALVVLSGCAGPSLQERRNLAIRDFQQNRFEPATVGFNAIIEKWPSDAVSYYYLGLISHAEGRSQMAVYYFQCALTADPGFKAARVAMEQVNQTLPPNSRGLVFLPTPGSLPTD